MAYVSGEASSIYDVIEKLDELMVQVGWTQHMVQKVSYNNNDRLMHCIWEGTGDGNDKIFLQALVDTKTNARMYLDSCAGYDQYLMLWEQPGSIQQWIKVSHQGEIGLQPAYTTAKDERFVYWIFVDTYRVIIVTRMSIVYESMYMGFINPIASERQYPYPMYIAGNGTSQGGVWPNNTQGSFLFPNGGSGYLRRADGTWRKFDFNTSYDYNTVGTVFPYNAKNERLIPNYREDDQVDQNNFLLIPVMLQTNDPIDVNGILRGVYWISGTRDLDAERILTWNNEQYIAFDTKQMRGTNSYFCVKLG